MYDILSKVICKLYQDYKKIYSWRCDSLDLLQPTTKTTTFCLKSLTLAMKHGMKEISHRGQAIAGKKEKKKRTQTCIMKT